MNAGVTLEGDLDARIASLGCRFDVAPGFLRDYLATRPHVREPVEAAADEADLFDRLGPLTGMYVRFALTTTERGRAFAEMVAPHVVALGRYLDIGCAYGGFLRALRERGAAVVGIEIQSELTQLARANLEGGPGEVLHADVLSIDPATLGAFDLIACNDVIEHVADAQALVHRVSAWLAPRGIAYFEIPNRDALSFVARDGHFQKFGLSLLPRALAARYVEVASGRAYDDMGEFHDEATYRRWFDDARLEVIDIPQPHAQRLADVHDRVFDAVNAFTWWHEHERTSLPSEVATAVTDRYWAYTAELFPSLERARRGIEATKFERRYLAPFWTFVLRRKIV